MKQTNRHEGRASIDPVQLEIMRQLLQSIPDEVETDLTRTAFSPLIYEYKDYAVGMVDVKGRIISQSRGGIPIFLANSLGLAVLDGLAQYADEGIGAGDVIVTNHAGTLGQHLNNVVMFAPIMDPADGKSIIAFMAILAHWTDVGGRYVGSSASNDTTEIFQEGIQFRSIKLRRAGVAVPETYRMIEYNTRFPAMVLGDVAAQLSGCVKGAALFEELARKFGAATLIDAIHALWDRSEAAARAAVAAMPDGVYRAASFLDNDGIDLDKRIECPVTVRIEGERFIVDFSDISPQVRGPFNSGRDGGGISSARIAFKYLTTPNDPTNEGSFAPLEVILPDGKFLSASATAPMARYSAPLSTVVDTIIHAMEGAASGAIAAGHHASMGSHRFQGRHPVTGQLFSHLDTALGGWGGSHSLDGSGPFKTLAHGDTLDVPVEVQEAMYGLQLARIEFRQDSGGPGKYRGGLGLIKEYAVLHPVKLTLTFERSGCPPWGACGGGEGVPNHVELIRAGQSDSVRYLKVNDLALSPGDRVIIYTGGGGGFGNVLERDPKAVELDVRRGYVSLQAARDTYKCDLPFRGGGPSRTLEQATAPETRAGL